MEGAGFVFDWIIQGATIIDGTDAPGYVADVGIQSDKIAYIGKIAPEQGKNTISGKGKVLAPGFIDIHCHYDTGLWADSALEGPLSQGVTTVICGQCGDSRAPPLEDSVKVSTGPAQKEKGAKIYPCKSEFLQGNCRFKQIYATVSPCFSRNLVAC